MGPECVRVLNLCEVGSPLLEEEFLVKTGFFKTEGVRPTLLDKMFDASVAAAMKTLEATIDLVNQSAPRVH